MNSPASGTRHRFVNLAICCVIGSSPALHLQTSSGATVDEGNNHHQPLVATSMYSSDARPSPTGKKASHLRQPNLLCFSPLGTSMVTIMYFAPQLGQAKAIGSDLFGKQRAAICPQYGNSGAQCLADFGQYIVCLCHFMRDEARRIAANIAKAAGAVASEKIDDRDSLFAR